MTCIIPLLNSHNPADHEELRYALRSLTLQGVTRCILVGGRPKWYTGDHIPHADYNPKFKEQNIRDKVLLGASYIDGEFLYTQDDVYMMAPYAGVHNKGLLSQTLQGRNAHSSYYKSIANTIEAYGDVLDTDTHGPVIMDSKAVSVCYSEWKDFGQLFKTTYCHLNQVSSAYYPDAKIDTPPEPGRLYFSTRMFKPWLRDYFPLASPFEK